MSRGQTVVCWALVALLAWPWFQGAGTGAAPSSGSAAETGPAPAPASDPAVGPVARWLGPIGGLAASWEWVRWTTALRRGELARAHRHAARALALDPASPEGWLALAQHLVFDRSAAAVEADHGRRVAFARAGLDVLRRGEQRAREGATLALIGGDLAVFLAERAQPVAGAGASGPPERDLAWPGGPEALLAEAAASYARARDLGHPDASERLARLQSLR